jgi:hypothetical protein
VAKLKPLNVQQQRAGQAITVKFMKSISYTLNSPSMSTGAKALAENYWQDYGPRILSNLGCSS